jgi:hypothetical protein
MLEGGILGVISVFFAANIIWLTHLPDEGDKILLFQGRRRGYGHHLSWGRGRQDKGSEDTRDKRFIIQTRQNMMIILAWTFS